MVEASIGASSILVEELKVSEEKIGLLASVNPFPDELWYRAVLRIIPMYVEEGSSRN